MLNKYPSDITDKSIHTKDATFHKQLKINYPEQIYPPIELAYHITQDTLNPLCDTLRESTITFESLTISTGNILQLPTLEKIKINHLITQALQLHNLTISNSEINNAIFQFTSDNRLRLDNVQFTNSKLLNIENKTERILTNLGTTEIESCKNNCTFNETKFQNIKFKKTLEDKFGTEKSQIENSKFSNCTFEGCIFLEVEINNSEFENCTFINCNFINCIILNNSSFKGNIMRNSQFINCQSDKSSSLTFEEEKETILWNHTEYNPTTIQSETKARKKLKVASLVLVKRVNDHTIQIGKNYRDIKKPIKNTPVTPVTNEEIATEAIKKTKDAENKVEAIKFHLAEKFGIDCTSQTSIDHVLKELNNIQDTIIFAIVRVLGIDITIPQTLKEIATIINGINRTNQKDLKIQEDLQNNKRESDRILKEFRADQEKLNGNITRIAEELGNIPSTETKSEIKKNLELTNHIFPQLTNFKNFLIEIIIQNSSETTNHSNLKNLNIKSLTETIKNVLNDQPTIIYDTGYAERQTKSDIKQYILSILNKINLTAKIENLEKLDLRPLFEFFTNEFPAEKLILAKELDHENHPITKITNFLIENEKSLNPNLTGEQIQNLDIVKLFEKHTLAHHASEEERKSEKTRFKVALYSILREIDSSIANTPLDQVDTTNLFTAFMQHFDPKKIRLAKKLTDQDPSLEISINQKIETLTLKDDSKIKP